LNWLDFRTDRNFEREVKKLIARLTGKSVRQTLKIDKENKIPLQSTDSLTPDLQEEIIVKPLSMRALHKNTHSYPPKMRGYGLKKEGSVWDQWRCGCAN